MPVKTDSWAVVATVDEPTPLVQAFVAWHLSQGATEVFLYCDRPDDPVLTMMGHLPQVRVTACDDRHWSSVGKSRPRRHQVRQVRNACHAYHQCQCDWLLHCDADEYLWAHCSMVSYLSRADQAVDALALPVAERVFDQQRPQRFLDGHFRRPFMGRKVDGRAIFGQDYDLTNRGLTGHVQGKSFVRTGRDLLMSIHRPQPVGENDDPVIKRAQPDAVELLHFDGLTPLHWTFKLMRMADALINRNGMPPAPHRRRQADALLARPGDAMALHDRLKRPDQDLLRTRGLLQTPQFDVGIAIARYFPNAQIDLSMAGVDRWLIAHKQPILDFINQ